ncbi:MAG: transglutaminase domain-containing protein [Bacteroidales bacterium]|nr:transglutaminase domain-containing protein [Candidatus Physcousia equi]
MKLLKTTLCGLFLTMGLQSEAQNSMVIHYINGETSTVPMKDIESITFDEIEEEDDPEGEETTPEFPANDGSQTLYQTDKAYNLMLLLQKTDAQRAMSRSMFPELTDDQFATIKKKADEVCQYCTTDAARIDALNTWVKKNMTYDQAPTEPWTVFNNLKGVCQAYSNLLKVMLLTQGIPCVGINGWYGTVGAHAWVYGYANDTKEWWVCDPTNSYTVNKMTDYKSYSKLNAEFTDIELFEDDQFAYNLYSGYFNVCRIKKAGKNLVIPFSKEGFKINSFNPNVAIPSTVRDIYIGANIETIGTQSTRIGLKAYPAQDERCHVDEGNAELGSYEGVIYTRDYARNLNSILYIPRRMTTITMMPMETVWKNTITRLESVEVIIFPAGTKKLEAYAIEDCPSLRLVRVPQGCDVDAQAVYKCSNNVEIEYY